MPIGIEMLESTPYALGFSEPKHSIKVEMQYENSLRSSYEVQYIEHSEGFWELVTPALTQISSNQDDTKGSLTFYELQMALRELLGDKFQTTRLIVPLIGSGNTERHIVILYKDENDKYTIFDSKLSDPKRFLSDSAKPDSRLFDRLAAILRSFRWRFRPRVQWPIVNSDVQYEALGTQSIFDPVTCGYHTMVMSNTIRNLVLEGKPVNRSTVLEALKQGERPVVSALKRLEGSDYTVRTNFSAFLRKAWHKTFNNPDGRDAFRHYFLGFPKSDESKLWWVLLPFVLVKNVAKLVTEYPLSLVTTVFDYIRNALYQAAPMNWFTKGLRTVTLGVFQGLYFLTESMRRVCNTVLSPAYLLTKVRHKKPDDVGFDEGDDDEVASHASEPSSIERMHERGLAPNSDRNEDTRPTTAQSVVREVVGGVMDRFFPPEYASKSTTELEAKRPESPRKSQ